MRLPSFPTLLAASVYLQLSLISGADIANLGEDTIGAYMLTHPPDNYTVAEVAQTPDCMNFTNNIDASTLDSTSWSCASSSSLLRRQRSNESTPMFPTYSYSVISNGSNGDGYNITLPLELCSSTVIGNVMSPDGSLVQDATLQSVWTSLATLTSDELFDYIESIIQTSLDHRQQQFDTLSCDRSSTAEERELLTTIKTIDDVSGLWVLSVGKTAGMFGVIFGLYYVPMVNPGLTANFTKVDNLVGIAIAGTLVGLYSNALDYLHKEKKTNAIEAYILTVFLTAADNSITLLQETWLWKQCVLVLSLPSAVATLLRLLAEGGLMAFGNGNAVIINNFREIWGLTEPQAWGLGPRIERVAPIQAVEMCTMA